MSKDFIINPCKSCMKKFGSDSYDVNQINQCCYETLDAFKGTGSVNSVRTSSAAKNCIDCVQKAIKNTGKDPCDLRIDPPALWGNVPHFFPRLLNEMKDVEKAGIECKNMCLDTRYPNECIENCHTDMNAVEKYGKKPSASVREKRKYPVKTSKSNNSNNSNNNKYITVTIVVSIILALIYSIWKISKLHSLSEDI